MMSWYLEWIGCAFGAVGALVLASNTRISGWGFVLFLVSNACWIGYGKLQGQESVVYMQSVMTCTSLLGAYRWLFCQSAVPVPKTQKTGVGGHFRARKSAP